MNIRKNNKEDERMVRESIDKSPLCMREAAKLSGIPFSTFKRIAKKLNIYMPNQGRKGRKFPGLDLGRVPLGDILTNKVIFNNGQRLKNRLIKNNLLINKCACCGLDEWQNKEITLQLHHVNGCHSDNSLENLQLLCPNCHSQTPTFGNKNSKGKINVTDEQLIKSYKTYETIKHTLIDCGLNYRNPNYVKRLKKVLAENNIELKK